MDETTDLGNIIKLFLDLCSKLNENFFILMKLVECGIQIFFFFKNNLYSGTTM